MQGVRAMHGRVRSIVLAASIVLAVCHPAPGQAGISQQVPVGPRAIAMGGAFGAIADDATATYWNTAGLPWIGHQEITATHADLYGSGLNDNFVSFVLPLSPSQAAAIDWYRSAFDDNELNFGEDRIDLAYGHKITSIFSAGFGVKYLSRNIDVDGSRVRSGSGVGLDLGVVVQPLHSVRLAGVMQDVFDTKLTYSNGDGVTEAYPRTTRAGAAFTPKRWGTLAVDIDDLLHTGMELRPMDAIALRAGVASDLSG